MDTARIDVFTFSINPGNVNIQNIIGPDGGIVTGFGHGIDANTAIMRTHCLYGALKLMGLPYMIVLCDFTDDTVTVRDAIVFLVPFNEELTEEEFKEVIASVERIKKVEPPYIYKSSHGDGGWTDFHITGYRIAANEAHFKKLTNLGEILA